MKIAVKDNIAVSHGDDLQFIDGKLKPFIDLNESNTTIYDNVTLPDNFRAGCFTYIDGVFEATPELQARLDAEQAQQEQALLEQKRVEWEQEFYKLDQLMPRYVEDLIEMNSLKVPTIVQDKYNSKKSLRQIGKDKGYI